MAVNLVRMLMATKVVSERKLLELFPPFLFMGVKVLSVSPDYRRLHLRVPNRWYGRNMHGTLFGGFICAVSDPLATLLCSKMYPDKQIWTKRNAVDYIRPARDTVDVWIEITEADIQTIEKELEAEGQATHTFYFEFVDTRGRIIAKVENTVFIRNRAPKE